MSALETSARSAKGLVWRKLAVSCGASRRRDPANALALRDRAADFRQPPGAARRQGRPDPVELGAPVSVFELGAILLYLAEKTRQFIPQDFRGRAEVLQWLFWQMGGLGPMAGQNHHFSQYAPEKIPYAIDRYVKETNRLPSVDVSMRHWCTLGAISGEISAASIAKSSVSSA